ncbi:MAG TPA: hypothetical protein VGB43_08530 [Flavobacterium sp.]
MRLLYFILICFSLGVNGQTSEHSNIAAAKNAGEAREMAKSDIKGQSISLFVQGGFAPTVGKSDLPFENKYHLKIRDFGCTALEYKIISAYNHEIFRHLTAQYGSEWITEIRKDVIGLREFKQKNQKL